MSYVEVILRAATLLAALLAAQQPPSNPVTARDYYNELKAANEFKTYGDEYVCFYDDDVPSFLVAARGEDVVQLRESNGERITKDFRAAATGHLFYKTYYKGVLTANAEEMPPVKDASSYSNVSYQTIFTHRDNKTKFTITYTVNWATGRIRMTVETGTIGTQGYSMNERFGKCEFIHPETAVLLDESIPKELRENRCFQSKSAEDRKKWLDQMNTMPRADYEKTIKDLSVINASDRLTGARGCTLN